MVRVIDYMEYSVIRSGNKQYIVTKGDEVDVDLLSDLEGEITFETLLRVTDKDVEIGEPLLESGTKGTIMGISKDKKKQGIKYKPGGYRRKFGHRQKYTRVTITQL